MIGPLEELVDRLRALPGIGRKSAERITFYLMNAPQEDVTRLAEAIGSLRTSVRRCRECFNFSTDELCDICTDPKRDPAIICVVGHPWEILKIDRTGEYHGRYHVLGGLVSPMDGVGTGDLTIDALLARIKKEGIQEVILALEPKLEGEITGMHLVSLLKPLGVRVSQIAQGIPVGRDLEFADEVTLGRALRGRVELG
jgi:recombination protein RecR